MQYKDWLDRYKDLVRFNMDLDSFITKYQYRRPSQWGHLALIEIAQDLPSQALRVSDISTVRSDIRELAGLKFERIVIIAVDIDKGVIRNLLPDSLKSTIEFQPLLDVGEALVVGDAILLPSKILLDKPPEDHQPISETKNFWDERDARTPNNDAVIQAVEALRRQSRIQIYSQYEATT